MCKSTCPVNGDKVKALEKALKALGYIGDPDAVDK